MLARAEERAGHAPGVAQRLRARPQRLVQRLCGGQAAHLRVLHGVVGGRRLAVERGADALQRPLQRAARVGLQRGQDLVELDRRPGLRERDQPAVGERARRRRARLQVDVEVALEEQPRPDLQRRVAVQRLAVVVDAHRDERVVGVLVALGLDDLADVHAGDPDRRVRPQQVGALDDRLDLEVVAQRDRLREPEVRDEQGEEDGQQPRAQRRHPELLVASHFCNPRIEVLSTNVPWSPGTLPITCWFLV